MAEEGKNWNAYSGPETGTRARGVEKDEGELTNCYIITPIPQPQTISTAVDESYRYPALFMCSTFHVLGKNTNTVTHPNPHYSCSTDQREVWSLVLCNPSASI